MKNEAQIKRLLLMLILVSTIIRGIIASLLEFGNDEVYYWTYALYPDLSHFDHPPMVGWMIQLFSLDLFFNNEFFIRLSSILFGGVNTWLIYMIGKKMKDPITGWYAALIYTASIYCFIICGVFILPDTPQVLFWLISVYLLISVLPGKPGAEGSNRKIIIAGITIGLALLSKYTSIFLWFGAALYIILYNREWLRSIRLYTAVLISLVLFVPVIIWNINNHFISFTYQGERVGFFGSGIRLDYFFTEIAGQFFYNNPVNVILIILAVVFCLKKKNVSSATGIPRLLMTVSFPLILLFLFFSLFRSTLPHWTGPAYITLIPLSAMYLREKARDDKIIPGIAKIALGVLIVAVVLGFGQVRFGWLYKDRRDDIKNLGEKDISLDMFGWKQIGAAFKEVYQKDISNGTMPERAVIFSYRWFPAASLDYYAAMPAGTHVLAIGDIGRIHKYAWINEERGGFHPGMDGYYITTSRDFADPDKEMKGLFEEINCIDTVPVYRGKAVAEYAFIYRLKKMK